MSCLFESLSKFIIFNKNQLEHNQLREQICKYLNTNPKLYDENANKIVSFTYNISLNDYVSEMNKQNTWGSAIEIKSFCNIYNIIVIVEHNNNQIKFLPSNNNQKPLYVITIGYTGNHYFPISASKIK